MKSKSCDIRTRKMHLFLGISSTNFGTLVASLCQCVETRSIEVFWLLFQPLPQLRFNLSVLERISRPICEPLYTTDTSHCEQETCLYEYPFYWVILSTKSHSITMLFGSAPLKHDRNFDYWNQSLNMRMRVRYLDSHEFGLRCHLAIHIENLLRPLQLFYFHMWPIYYWLSFVV
jgi:hypothetical protein